MKRTFSLLWLMLFTLYSWAQEVFQSKVVDAETGEPLPYVAIYVAKGRGTLTNDEGRFSIHVQPGDTLIFSYVGYERERVKAAELGKTLMLHPMRTALREVTVETTEAIIKKVIRKMNQDYNKFKKQEGTFFLRMTTEDQSHDELAEAFIGARSAINLRDLKYISGYRGELEGENVSQSHMKFSNAHYLLQLGPMVMQSDFWELDFIPLNKATWGKRKGIALFKTYRFWHETLVSKEGNLMYKIDMRFQADTLTHKVVSESEGQRVTEMTVKIKDALPMENLNDRRIIEGTLYVDAQTYEPLSFTGRVMNFYMNLKMANRDFLEPINMDFHVDFQQTNGFTEVKSFTASLKNKLLILRALLFNVNSVPAVKGSKAGENMQESIDKAGFDSSLWTEEIVLRTKREEEMARNKRAQ